jgi:hypothetical protein
MVSIAIDSLGCRCTSCRTILAVKIPHARFGNKDRYKDTMRTCMCVVFASVASPSTHTMAKFVSHRNNAPRYPEEVWESYKQVLVDKYMTMTIEALMNYMKREHGFSPT